jgi:hypothetical protein
MRDAASRTDGIEQGGYLDIGKQWKVFGSKLSYPLFENRAIGMALSAVRLAYFRRFQLPASSIGRQHRPASAQ